MLKSQKDDSGDELADLFGGLGLDQGKCEICGTALSRDEKEAGEVRCLGCTQDLEAVGESVPKKKPKKEKTDSRNPRSRARPMILDSDDEDDDGTPIKKKERRRRPMVLDSDDEDEESGVFDDKAEESSTPESDDEEPRRRAYSGSETEETDDDSYGGYGSSHLSSSTKIDNLMKILRVEFKERNKTIVFSQWTSMLDMIQPFLEAEGMTYARYDGSMKHDDREDSLARIRGDGPYTPRLDANGKDRNFCGVLLCSLKCGALGLNLIAACRVVILEPFWNPFVEEQAIDRVHRFGQKRDVAVYKLTIEGTVEERILRLQENKRALAKAAMGDGKVKGKTGKLNMKELLYLFRRDAELDPMDAAEDRLAATTTKTRILKETRPVSSLYREESGEMERERRRYAGAEEQRRREERRERERDNPFGRR